MTNKQKICKWWKKTFNDGYCAGCGNHHYKHHHPNPFDYEWFKFCPYCGNKIEVVK